MHLRTPTHNNTCIARTNCDVHRCKTQEVVQRSATRRQNVECRMWQQRPLETIKHHERAICIRNERASQCATSPSAKRIHKQSVIICCRKRMVCLLLRLRRSIALVSCHACSASHYACQNRLLREFRPRDNHNSALTDIIYSLIVVLDHLDQTIHVQTSQRTHNKTGHVVVIPKWTRNLHEARSNLHPISVKSSSIRESYCWACDEF